jgi:acyl-CoA synthetase (NDP forming)
VTAYLTDVLRRLPAILPSDTAAIRALLPDQWAQANPKHIHASRDEELREDNARRRKRRANRQRAIVQ